jgi:ribosomal protein S18 acetylase RimI-like enzyme
MDDERLAAISDESYFDWWRVWVAALPGTDVVEQDGVLLARTGAREEWWNIAFVMRRLDSPDEAIRAAVNYFDDHKQPFILRVRDGVDPAAEAASEALGVKYNDTIPGMTLHPIPAIPDPPPGLEIRTADDEKGLADFIEISAEAYGMSAEGLRKLITLDLLRHPRWFTYVGYVDGRAATTSTLLVTGDIAGVYWVGTRNDFRKRGLGEALTWHTISEGAKAGCTVSALQASDMGKPIYERMGFRVVAGYRTFVRK